MDSLLQLIRSMARIKLQPTSSQLQSSRTKNRALRYYLLVGLFLFQISSFAQIDPRKLDSLRRSIDSSARSIRMWQDSFRGKQDSLYRSGVINGTDSTALLENQVQREEKKITYTIVLIGVVFFIVLILVIRGRKRPST